MSADRHERRGRGFSAAVDPLARWALRAPEPHRAAALWALVAGPAIRERTRVLACRGTRLEVAVREERWCASLSAMEEDLLAGLNRRAGARLYERIQFVTEPEEG